MTIFLGADHGGFTLKNKVKAWLEAHQYQVEDLGATSLEPTDDYPEFALKVAQHVAAKNHQLNESARGILVCRSGGGMVMAANKVVGAYAVAVHSQEAAQHARTNDGATIISLAGDWFDHSQLEAILTAFLSTDFDETSRHGRRLQQIKNFETRGELPNA